MPLTFKIETVDGEREYTIPPIGWESGKRLTELLTDRAKADKSKMSTEDLFALALSPPLLEQMSADGAEYVAMYRVGVAALTHFNARIAGLDDTRAKAAFDSVLESGLDPEALARRVAGDESSTTSPSTDAAASSTKSLASTSGTRSRSNSKATRSARTNSSPPKHGR